MNIRSRQTLPAQLHRDSTAFSAIKGSPGSRYKTQIASTTPSTVSRSMAMTSGNKSFLTSTTSRRRLVSDVAVEKQINSVYRQQAYKDAAAAKAEQCRQSWLLRHAHALRNEPPPHKAIPQPINQEPCFGTGTDSPRQTAEETPPAAFSAIDPATPPTVAPSAKPAYLSTGPEYGNLLLSVFTPEEASKLSLLPRLPELLFRTWFDDVPLTASAPDHLRFHKEILAQVMNSYGCFLTVDSNDGSVSWASNSAHDDTHFCGCNGGSVWRIRIGHMPRGDFQSNSLMTKLKAWIESPDLPPLWDIHCADPEVEVLILQYMGELRCCGATTIQSGCPQYLIGSYLSTSQAVSNNSVFGKWLKSTQRQSETTARLQRLTIHFNKESCLFTCYKQDRRKGQCNLFTLYGGLTVKESPGWSNNLAFVPCKVNGEPNQATGKLRIACLLDTTKSCQRFCDTIDASKTLPPILTTRLLPNKSAIQSVVGETSEPPPSIDPMIFLLEQPTPEVKEEVVKAELESDLVPQATTSPMEDYNRSPSPSDDEGDTLSSRPSTEESSAPLSFDENTNVVAGRNVRIPALHSDGIGGEFTTPKTLCQKEENLTFRSPM
eukprot:Blabericola_migrator_1__1918@NODE_1521_length_4352_cov_38_816103_g1001_i0_p1_GENE_NODE_1521_length_4352_cov_38_816103_g1001_i0NODE_1521_length_4352_cov_38_816103_g1001_i0_p1_ORF_typecomplete_len603_score81_72_NODE_1521_length_4352_cov_38_816103_g1001_i020693877